MTARVASAVTGIGFPQLRHLLPQLFMVRGLPKLPRGTVRAISAFGRAPIALRAIRARPGAHDSISYLYIVGPENVLLGVVDLRDLVMAPDSTTLGEIMISPVVSAAREDMREDLEALFAKYHFRMLPVVDERDRLLGVINYQDIMKGLVARAKI